MTALLAACLLAVCDLAEVFSTPEAWKESSVDFTVDRARDGFEFASEKRDIVKCMRRGACSWHGLDVWETRIYYGPDGATKVEMSLYNRGDDRSGAGLGDAALKAILNRVGKCIDAKAKPPTPEKRKLRTGGFLYTRRWTKTDPNAELVWGVTGDKAATRTADFVRLVVSPKPPEKPKGAVKSSVGKASKVAKNNVVKTPEGDVYVKNVPMVDQGQKGYCAAAVAERVLRYYGHDVDEHQVAQMAGTSALGGTSVSEMKEAVKAIASKCHLGYREIVTLVGSVKDLEEELERYAKSAKAMKEPELSMSDFTHGNMIDVGGIRRAMKPKVVKRMRTKDSRYKKFLTQVKAHVDQGIPVIWGVTLGIFPEPGLPQVFGGHMRLIVGYNAKTHEILYSDTWGAGHELKRMPEDWAFAITDDAFAVRPL